MNILIIYTSTGLGHKKIAENIGSVLAEEHKVDLIDLFDVEPGKLVSVGQKIYFWILKYWPGLWEFFYSNRVFLKLTLPLRTTVAGFKSKKVLEVLEGKVYEAVICTHTNASAIVSYLKQKGMYSGKFIIAFSDFHLHPYWVYKNADLYLANVQEQKDQMAQMGINPDRIAICGITLSEKKDFDIASVRSKFGAADNEKVVMLMSGSRGTGVESETVSELAKLNAKIFVLCGLNGTAKQQIEKQFAGHKNVVALGWVDPRELYVICDIAVTKPGGLTVAECLQYGLPILISHYLPGQERLNTEYLLEKQLVMPEFVDMLGIAEDELDTHTFKEELKSNPNVLAIVQHGSTVKEAISRL